MTKKKETLTEKWAAAKERARSMVSEGGWPSVRTANPDMVVDPATSPDWPALAAEEYRQLIETVARTRPDRVSDVHEVAVSLVSMLRCLFTGDQLGFELRRPFMEDYFGINLDEECLPG